MLIVNKFEEKVSIPFRVEKAKSVVHITTVIHALGNETGFSSLVFISIFTSEAITAIKIDTIDKYLTIAKGK